MAKSTICLWYDKDAEAAARFYAETFPDSTVGAIHRAPGDYPFGKKGDVLTVEFKVAGVSCIGLNGGPTFKHGEAAQRFLATLSNRSALPSAHAGHPAAVDRDRATVLVQPSLSPMSRRAAQLMERGSAIANVAASAGRAAGRYA
jgi:hypothetical protein